MPSACSMYDTAICTALPAPPPPARATSRLSGDMMSTVLLCCYSTVQAPKGSAPDVWQQLLQHCRNSTECWPHILQQELLEARTELARAQARIIELERQLQAQCSS